MRRLRRLIKAWPEPKPFRIDWAEPNASVNRLAASCARQVLERESPPDA